MGQMAFGSNSISLYVHDGRTSTLAVGQERPSYPTDYYQLDLSANWTITRPSWKILPIPDNCRNVRGVGGIVLADGRFLVTGGNNNSKGIIYVLNNPIGSCTVLSEKSLPEAASNMEYVTWAEVMGQGSIIGIMATFKSSTGEANTTVHVVEKNKATQELEWVLMFTGGELPRGASEPCVTKSFDGKKLYFFGGESGARAYSGSLHELDLTTRQWTKLGVDTDGRAGAACAATEKAFVVWGGMANAPGTGLAYIDTTRVFDLNTKAWVNNFEAKYLPPPPPPAPSPSHNSTTGGNGTNTDKEGKPTDGSGEIQMNIAAIAGGVAGGVVLLTIIIATIVYFVVRWRKRKLKNRNGQATNVDQANLSDLNGPTDLSNLTNPTRSRAFCNPEGLNLARYLYGAHPTISLVTGTLSTIYQSFKKHTNYPFTEILSMSPCRCWILSDACQDL
ncbi:hypothetical protein BGW38_002253 [Lunasporangiospora selenospora]|uniref:Kelch motif-containing protein n=1 Tax=Lunasporangiospora selenospora TaxID=979761 RepID=A0A9P6FUE3_9FUNG|nr:hypothetical protein BGW38_002253 [Lunasporangiospora selenospora]